MIKSGLSILLSLGLFFAIRRVACIPVLLLALQRAVKSHFTPGATKGRQFVARRIATNYKILLLHFKGFRIKGESEEYYSLMVTTENEFRHTL